MPDRVVTVDLQTALQPSLVRILWAKTLAYNPAGLPVRWRGGYYLDLLCEITTSNGDLIDANAFEFAQTTPGRLFEEGGGRHTFLGWNRPDSADEIDISDGTLRQAVLTYDVSRASGRRFWRELDFIPLGRGAGFALEMLIDAPNNSGAQGPHIYDALDDHPPELRTALERRGTNRRRTEADPPPGWGDRSRGP